MVDGDTVKVRAYGAKRALHRAADRDRHARDQAARACRSSAAAVKPAATCSGSPTAQRATATATGCSIRRAGPPASCCAPTRPRTRSTATAGCSPTSPRRGGVSLQRRQLSGRLGRGYVYGCKPFQHVRAFRAAERRARQPIAGSRASAAGTSTDPPTTRPRARPHAGTGATSTASTTSRPTKDSQGAGWRAVFKERAAGRVSYRGLPAPPCRRHPSLLGPADQCKRRLARVRRAVRQRPRRPGKWRARWRLVDGHQVASWHFKVRPEFG